MPKTNAPVVNREEELEEDDDLEDVEEDDEDDVDEDDSDDEGAKASSSKSAEKGKKERKKSAPRQIYYSVGAVVHEKTGPKFVMEQYFATPPEGEAFDPKKALATVKANFVKDYDVEPMKIIGPSVDRKTGSAPKKIFTADITTIKWDKQATAVWDGWRVFAFISEDKKRALINCLEPADGKNRPGAKPTSRTVNFSELTNVKINNS